MHLVRFTPTGAGVSRPAVGVSDGTSVAEMSGYTSLSSLLRLDLAELREACEQTLSAGERRPVGEVTLAAPVDGDTEVWAAGVTYRRSEEARVEESEGAARFYQAVYEADRPELFFKSLAWRVAGDGEAISVRRDSSLDVPEPELAVVCNHRGDVVGYTVANDVSSREIEGANPLYLPQAKVWLGSCALGPAIRPSWEVADPYALGIHMRIWRGGESAWEGDATTADLHRRIDDLLAYLQRDNRFHDGVVLSTGTCLVPAMGFSLEAGDRVEISIDEIGTLSNPVVRGADALDWADSRARQP